MNLVVMLLLLEVSFAPFYGEYLYGMIVAIYAFSTFVDVLFGGFMGEALLICPIKALIRVVGLITHLAAEDLLMYILAHRVIKSIMWLITGAKSDEPDDMLSFGSSDEELE